MAFRVAGRRGKALQKLRKDHGIDQREIAKRLGVEPAYLSRVENEHGGYGVPRGFGRDYQVALLGLLAERGN